MNAEHLQAVIELLSRPMLPAMSTADRLIAQAFIDACGAQIEAEKQAAEAAKAKETAHATMPEVLPLD